MATPARLLNMADERRNIREWEFIASRALQRRKNRMFLFNGLAAKGEMFPRGKTCLSVVHGHGLFIRLPALTLVTVQMAWDAIFGCFIDMFI